MVAHIHFDLLYLLWSSLLYTDSGPIVRVEESRALLAENEKAKAKLKILFYETNK